MSGVKINVGIIDISSKLSAKTAFMKNYSEKRNAVKNRTVRVKSGLTTVKSG